MTHHEETTQATILIVDDTPENLAVLSEVLQPTWRVRAANSGRRALQIAGGETPPDLILLDVMMPEMDGYEVIAQLKSNPLTADIPVIFATAMDATEDEERGLDHGAVDYITKPLRPAIVRARVRTHLELRRAKAHLKNENIYLEAEVARRMRQNQIIQEVSIHALARLAETRDPETGNHLRRTQGYVRTLAEALREHPRFAEYLQQHTVDLLVRSAPLHDIGKVGIPDHVLLKPGKLTSDEWAIMQTHSRLGHDAIELAEQDAEETVEFLAIAKEIAHYHHEKWDGSGYPNGLAGDAIPIAARLMALADVFDALICRRVYKPPMPIEQARSIIVEGRGLHFDPDIVDAFVLNFATFAEIARRYSDDDML
ncbi:MAG: cyclic di-GMP phosphodiesterase [Pseudomonadota bacterium]|nr:cyclic di-GMP phosphodiesterase [Pseudomonadota bacterium]